MKKVLLALALVASIATGYSKTPAKKAEKASITSVSVNGPAKLKNSTLRITWKSDLPKGTMVFLSICNATDPLSVQNTQWVSAGSNANSFNFPLKKELLPKGLKTGSKVTVRMMTVLPTKDPATGSRGPAAVSSAFAMM